MFRGSAFDESEADMAGVESAVGPAGAAAAAAGGVSSARAAPAAARDRAATLVSQAILMAFIDISPFPRPVLSSLTGSDRARTSSRADPRDQRSPSGYGRACGP